ncbi:hypothetical protein A3B87_02840 [Candidatus Kuenenbacteria bacterium RIFCSPHIGHO2_02_FULL_39_13]|uniref:Uncharacterized protein n=1 Tax=Candidatus Kuenenbacteria bacterium RIFCSPHIGHO2_02_FULL_39_13 TaxID=1798561 RepID=A0A1F6FNV5_9BACT|nr:MAG: hypothetical protein A3B87_02840 [Candidatus Kuenenbacteria bacterium RIFCSPHIGHO2_02_FULL_39_13]
MYTKGTGSGHLTRINAVYKGFVRAGIRCDFYASAYRSKYLNFIEPGIIVTKKSDFPKNIDIFICDWRSDDFVDGLSKSIAKTWIGLRRLGKMKSTFPDYFHVIAIEPDVKGDVCIWPIISVWPDELVSRFQFNKILKIKPGSEVALLCENGAYPKHLNKVFNCKLPKKVKSFRCSNSKYSEHVRDLSYYPVAKLFKATDYLVIGGGYNSLHEALSYADLKKTIIVIVGGDDQESRIKKSTNWPKHKGSQAHILAKYITDYHIKSLK